MRVFIALFFILNSFNFTQAAPPKNEKIEEHEAWYVVMMNDARIGYRHINDYKIKNDQEVRYRTQYKEHIKVKRLGQLMENTSTLVIEENEFGQIQSFEQQIQTNGQGDIVSQGKLLAGNMNVETRIGGRKTLHSVKLPLLAISPEYPARHFRTAKSKGATTYIDVPITFNIFLPENLSFNQVKFTKQGSVEQKLLDGKIHQLTKVSVLNLAIPAHKSFYLLDEQGEIRYTYEENMVGKLISHRVTKDLALQDLAGEQLDLSISSMFEPKPVLKTGHRGKKIVYHVTAPDATLPWKCSPALSHEIKQLNSNTVEIIARKVLLPESAKNDPQKNSDSTLENCLKSTMFIQSDADEIVKLANQITAATVNPAVVAKLEEKYVFKHMSKNQFSSNLGSALEVAKSWQGDCTEHAVLLCALLRAKKVPARIAIGLVYVDAYQAFGGHMWTEVFLNEDWYPLDATLGQGGISPAYIKISDTPLTENAPVPSSLLTPLLSIPRNLQIKVVSEDNN